MTKKDREFKWSKEAEDSFQLLKGKLLSAPVLVHFTPNLPVTIHSDASKIGISGILCHTIDGKDHPVS